MATKIRTHRKSKRALGKKQPRRVLPRKGKAKSGYVQYYIKADPNRPVSIRYWNGNRYISKPVYVEWS